jgi:hypothetical protein
VNRGESGALPVVVHSHCAVKKRLGEKSANREELSSGPWNQYCRTQEQGARPQATRHAGTRSKVKSVALPCTVL